MIPLELVREILAEMALKKEDGPQEPASDGGAPQGESTTSTTSFLGF